MTRAARFPGWSAALLLAALFAGVAATNANGEEKAADGEAVLRRYAIDGIAGDGTPVRAELLCHPDRRGGAISLHLLVAKALSRGDLDYEAFEGPDAPARDADLTRLELRSEGADASLERTAAGWFGGDEPGTFVLGVSELSGKPSPLASLLGRIGTSPAQLTWTQTGFADRHRRLVARFELDAARAKSLRDAVAPCLP